MTKSSEKTLRGRGGIPWFSLGIFSVVVWMFFGAPIVQGSIFFETAVLARVGAQALGGTKPEVSINDFGRVAFIGQDVAGGFSFNQVWTSDSPDGAVKVGAPTWSSSQRDFGFPQINNSNRIISRDRISGSPPSFLIRSWDLATGEPTTLHYYYQGNPVLLPSLSNDGWAAYVEIDTASAPPQTYIRLLNGAFSNRVASFTGNVSLRPMVADGGLFVVRGGGAETDPIELRNSAGTVTSIASAPNFSLLGQSPGIADDGSAVAFMGVLSSAAPHILTSQLGVGIFLNVDEGGGTRKILRVAGLPGELGYDAAGIATAFGTFSTNSRVGVTHIPMGAAGLAGDSFVVCFQGTPAANDRVNPITGNPLLFTDQEGIWTVRVDVEAFQESAASLGYHRRGTIPVAQVGDTIGGDVVTALSLYDPVANVATDLTGTARTQRRGDHQVAFSATTAMGAMVVRARMLDSDLDGLLDHWESTGLDMDQDGRADLNLAAMGASPVRRDLFLELDWGADQPGHTHRPAPGVIRRVANNFTSATALTGAAYGFRHDGMAVDPIPASITVHVDAGPGLDAAGSPYSRRMGAGPLQGGDAVGLAGAPGSHLDVVYFGTDGLLAIPGLNSRALDNIKRNFFGSADNWGRELVFHYGFIADFQGVLPQNSAPFIGMVAASTANQVTAVGALPAAIVPSLAGSGIKIVSGTGAGQVRQITGNVGSVISVSRNWRTRPDATSRFVVLRDSSGLAEAKFEPSPNGNSYPGNDFLMTLWTFGAQPGGYLGNGYVQWRTILHELGHTLGLRHCGTRADATLCIGLPATYFSLMSYAHQTTTPAAYALAGLAPVNSYSTAGDPTFDDWSNLKLDFRDVLWHIANCYKKAPGISSSEIEEPEPEMTSVQYLQMNSAVKELNPPVVSIESPLPGAVMALNSPLKVTVAAVDDGKIASVWISADLNGDETISVLDEALLAAPTGTNRYTVEFPAFTGAASVRELVVTAIDDSMNPSEIAMDLSFAAEGCTYVLDRSTVPLNPDGGTEMIQLTAGPSCPWTVSADVSWIEFTGVHSGVGPGQIPLRIQTNSFAAFRTGRATIGGKIVEFTQAPGKSSITLNPDRVELNPEGGGVVVDVELSEPCLWQAESRVPWLSVVELESTSAGASLEMVATPNTGSEGRVASVRIGNVNLNVVQRGQVEGDTGLEFLRTETGLRIRWRATLSSGLEETSSLAPPIQWSPVQTTISRDGDLLEATLQFSGQTRFYRWKP